MIYYITNQNAMEDYYITKTSECDIDLEYKSEVFNKKFCNYQSIIKNISVTTSDIKCNQSAVGTPVKSTIKTKTKLTPLFKEKPRQTKPSSQSVDITNNSKFKTKLEVLLNTICLSRGLNINSIYNYVIEFVNDYSIIFPKNNDKMTLTVLYCIVMSCRLNNIYFDIRLLSIELSISYKDIVDYFEEMIPDVTSNDNKSIILLDVIYNSNKNMLINDYICFLKKVVTEFKIPNQEIVDRLTELEIDEYKNNCQNIFEMMEIDIKCEYERQFCVTPDKVYIYAMFVVIKNKYKQVTERYICEYLAKKFRIPRVTIEKMKRLVTKCKMMMGK